MNNGMEIEQDQDSNGNLFYLSYEELLHKSAALRAEKVHLAATIIQANFRRNRVISLRTIHSVHKRLDDIQGKVHLQQIWTEDYLSRTFQLLANLSSADHDAFSGRSRHLFQVIKENCAATTIQSIFRSYSSQRQIQRMNDTDKRENMDTTRIQHLLQLQVTIRDAAVRIQSLIRGSYVRRDVNRNIHSATLVQVSFCYFLSRHHWQKARQAAVHIQSLATRRNVRRGIHEEKKIKLAREQRNRSAAVRIQSFVRGSYVRHNVNRKIQLAKTDTVRIQRLLCIQQEIVSAAVKIQSTFRFYLLRQRNKDDTDLENQLCCQEEKQKLLSYLLIHQLKKISFNNRNFGDIPTQPLNFHVNEHKRKEEIPLVIHKLVHLGVDEPSVLAYRIGYHQFSWDPGEIIISIVQLEQSTLSMTKYLILSNLCQTLQLRVPAEHKCGKKLKRSMLCYPFFDEKRTATMSSLFDTSTDDLFVVANKEVFTDMSQKQSKVATLHDIDPVAMPYIISKSDTTRAGRRCVSTRYEYAESNYDFVSKRSALLLTLNRGSADVSHQRTSSSSAASEFLSNATEAAMGCLSSAMLPLLQSSPTTRSSKKTMSSVQAITSNLEVRRRRLLHTVLIDGSLYDAGCTAFYSDERYFVPWLPIPALSFFIWQDVQLHPSTRTGLPMDEYSYLLLTGGVTMDIGVLLPLHDQQSFPLWTSFPINPMTAYDNELMIPTKPLLLINSVFSGRLFLLRLPFVGSVDDATSNIPLLDGLTLLHSSIIFLPPPQHKIRIFHRHEIVIQSALLLGIYDDLQLEIVNHTYFYFISNEDCTNSFLPKPESDANVNSTVLVTLEMIVEEEDSPSSSSDDTEPSSTHDTQVDMMTMSLDPLDTTLSLDAIDSVETATDAFYRQYFGSDTPLQSSSKWMDYYEHRIGTMSDIQMPTSFVRQYSSFPSSPDGGRYQQRQQQQQEEQALVIFYTLQFQYRTSEITEILLTSKEVQHLLMEPLESSARRRLYVLMFKEYDTTDKFTNVGSMTTICFPALLIGVGPEMLLVMALFFIRMKMSFHLNSRDGRGNNGSDNGRSSRRPPSDIIMKAISKDEDLSLYEMGLQRQEKSCSRGDTNAEDNCADNGSPRNGSRGSLKDISSLSCTVYYLSCHNIATSCSRPLSPEIAIYNAIVPYDYDYLGNGPRLVFTPLPDRVYVTATQALNLNMGSTDAGRSMRSISSTDSPEETAAAVVSHDDDIDVSEDVERGQYCEYFLFILASFAIDVTLLSLAVEDEDQILEITGTGTLSGFFRLKFSTSPYTPYISSDATAMEIQNALEQLPTIKQVFGRLHPLFSSIITTSFLGRLLLLETHYEYLVEQYLHAANKKGCGIGDRTCFPLQSERQRQVISAILSPISLGLESRHTTSAFSVGNIVDLASSSSFTMGVLMIIIFVIIFRFFDSVSDLSSSIRFRCSRRAFRPNQILLAWNNLKGNWKIAFICLLLSSPLCLQSASETLYCYIVLSLFVHRVLLQRYLSSSFFSMIQSRMLRIFPRFALLVMPLDAQVRIVRHSSSLFIRTSSISTSISRLSFQAALLLLLTSNFNSSRILQNLFGSI